VAPTLAELAPVDSRALPEQVEPDAAARLEKFFSKVKSYKIP